MELQDLLAEAEPADVLQPNMFMTYSRFCAELRRRLPSAVKRKGA